MNDTISNLETARNIIRKQLAGIEIRWQALTKRKEKLETADAALKESIELERQENSLGNDGGKTDGKNPDKNTVDEDFDKTGSFNLVNDSPDRTIHLPANENSGSELPENAAAQEQPGNRGYPVKFDPGYHNTDTIKSFSSEKFMKEVKIEIEPDEFKDQKIVDAAKIILGRLKEPQHKKQLAAYLSLGGKSNGSRDFPESVKSSLKQFTYPGGPLLVKNGWYCLREWNLSQWDFSQDSGGKIAE